MSSFWKTSVTMTLVISALILGLPSSLSAQRADQIAASRVLGPHWKHVSRTAGMVFAGTVLSVEPSGRSYSMPSVEMKFRVDRAIAGVQAGQVLTIHEWAGAAAGHPRIRVGQRLLLLLYSPSWLGLTSPVGGATGQIALDERGEIRQRHARSQIPDSPATGSSIRSASSAAASPPAITVAQLERAIRSAREE
jgi:hypothetical protein